MNCPTMEKDQVSSVETVCLRVSWSYGSAVSVQWTLRDGSTFELRGEPMSRWRKGLSQPFEEMLKVPENCRQTSFPYASNEPDRWREDPEVETETSETR